MLLRQIQYFQKVVECKSFTEAAEACHISQSAISQQVKALEDELGFALMVRKNRTFELTPAGSYFYDKSRGIIAQLEKLCAESRRIGLNERAEIKLGYLKNYGGHEFAKALSLFAGKYPKVAVSIVAGTHEELYELLVGGKVDLVLSDQRRAFSSLYNNLVLTEQKAYVEVPSTSSLASMPRVTVEELGDQTCMLVTSIGQEDIDKQFYRDILGFQSAFSVAYSLEEARMNVLAGKGCLPIEGNFDEEPYGILTRIPLYRGNEQIKRRYCAYWAIDNSGYYIEEFADMLQGVFQQT